MIWHVPSALRFRVNRQYVEDDSQRHWLTGIVNEDGDGSLPSSFEYIHRVDGQTTHESESVKQPDGSFITGTTDYIYDALNRLIKETYDGSVAGTDYTIDYGLDLVGNRIAKTTTNEGESPVTTVSEYDERDRLMIETIGSQQVHFTYDLNGSLTTKTGSDETTVFDWDAAGRMLSASVTKDDVTTTNGYAYTADGIRVSVTEGETTTRYVIDSLSPSGYSQVVEKWSSGENGEPVLLESTVYGIGLDPLSQYQPGGAVLFIGDGHSGPKQVVDGSGAVLLAQRWDAFGNVMAKAGVFLTNNGYRGERTDGLTGDLYLRARMYDPATGRFRSMDPFGGNYGDPHQMMRYGYAGGNPAWGIDPSGTNLAVSIGVVSLTIASLLVVTSSTGILDYGISKLTGDPSVGFSATTAKDGPIYYAGNEKQRIGPEGMGPLKLIDQQWTLVGKWQMQLKRDFGTLSGELGHAWIVFTNVDNPNEVHIFSRWLKGAGDSGVSAVTWNLPKDIKRNREVSAYTTTTEVENPYIYGGDGYSWNLFTCGSCDTYSTFIWNKNSALYIDYQPSLVLPAFSSLWNIFSPLEILTHPQRW
ncbi:MAG: RHS repeat-associated core domain-containing protein [Bacteroidales bacterium]|nr:RHS repeat-associated core domain-containing protein [Bacteroidales bacterium]